MKKTTTTMDKISQLPQPIQHHILSFLETKEVARTNLVSKTWRSIAHSLPIVDLSPSYILPRNKPRAMLDHDELLTLESNLSYRIEESIQRFTAMSSSIQKFHLEIDCYDPDRWDKRLDRWMQDLVTKLRLKELSLVIWKKDDSPPGKLLAHDYEDVELELLQNYTLHPHVLSSKTITCLRLVGCELKDGSGMRLDNLLKLSIEGIILNQKMIDNLIVGCPSMETLALCNCDGLSSICVSDLARLDRVVCMECFNLTRVKIVAPILRVFEFWVDPRIATTRYTHIELLACESTLKMLTMSNINMTKEGFKSFVSKLPQLERLVVYNLYMESIEIPNKKIRQLKIYDCEQLEKVEIGDPHQLHVLVYDGNKLPFYPQVNSKSFSNAGIDFQAKFGVRTEFQHLFSSWADSFRNLFLEFNQFRDIKLIVQYNGYPTKCAIVCEELDESFIDMLHYMKDKKYAHITIMRITSCECMIDHLLDWRSQRPAIISLISLNLQSKIDLLKILNKLKGNEESKCCTYVPYNKCWKHYLDSVEMINGEEVEFEISNVFMSSQITKFLDLFKSYDTAKYDIGHIKLHWNVK